MDLSIIIPVYNAENCISNAVEDLLKRITPQTEIIIVDDGSMDKTYEICVQLCKKSSAIHVLKKQNGGVSSARNFGLDYATGEYIAFMDADDFYSVPSFNGLIQKARNNDADIAIWGATKEFSDHAVQCKSNFKHGKCVFTNDSLKKLQRWCIERNPSDFKEIPCKTKNGRDKQNAFRFGSPWAKLIRKKIIGNILFDEKLSISEDLIFVNSILKNAQTVLIFNECIYRYIFNDNSATNLKFHKNRKQGYLNLAESFYDLKDDYDVRYKKAIFKEIVKCNWSGIKTGITYDDSLNKIERIKSKKEYSNCAIYREALEGLGINDFFNLRDKIIYLILRHKIFV